MDLVEARIHAKIGINALQQKLSSVFKENFELQLVGSLATGLYDSPKKSIFSGNINCPFDKVIEADVLLILSQSNPHNELVLEKMQQILSTNVFKKKFTFNWDSFDIPMSFLYTYETIEKNLGFEWEIGIAQKPYFDVTPYWDQLFTPLEMEWQRRLRKLITSVDTPSEHYSAFKWKQVTEAQWRILMSYLLVGAIEKQYLNEDYPDFPKFGDPKAPVDRIVSSMLDKWFTIQATDWAIKRPEEYISKPLYQILRSKYQAEYIEQHLMRSPEPVWVSYANRMLNTPPLNTLRPMSNYNLGGTF